MPRRLPPQQAAHVKTDYEPNARRELDLSTTLGEPVRRYPVRTELFSRDDDLDARVLEHVDRFFAGLPAAGPDHAAATRGPWWFFLSEKVVAITQGRSYFVWDIKVGRPARVLSRYVTRTPAGIGLGSPFTMQLAIQEAGLPRVLYASAGGAIGKVLGRKGLFYELVGNNINAIDGPTEYSALPAQRLGQARAQGPGCRRGAALRRDPRSGCPSRGARPSAARSSWTPTTSAATCSARTCPATGPASRRCSPTTRSARAASRPRWRWSSCATTTLRDRADGPRRRPARRSAADDQAGSSPSCGRLDLRCSRSTAASRARRAAPP